MMILSIIATVVLLGALFYHRVSLFLSSLILLAWTAALGVAGLWSIWLLVPLAIILVPFNLTPMRKSMISAPVFRGFRKVMPPMSRTEKEAIDAGTTWWEGDLFQGKPDWKKTAQLSTTATHCRRASVSRRPGRRSVPDGERFPDYP